MEVIGGNDIKDLELVAIEFNTEKYSFRAFFSYKNSVRPVFAVVINYYQSTTGIWKSFVSLQEPYNYMINADIYEKLRSELQEISNGFIKQYKKGAKINEEINHIISSHHGFNVSDRYIGW